MMKLAFHSSNCSRLFLCAEGQEKQGLISVISLSDGKTEKMLLDYNGAWYQQFDIVPGQSYIITAEKATIHLGYYWDPLNAKEEGIHFLRNDEVCEPLSIEEAYGQPLRNLFHFSALCGWMNDPNGLCFDGEYYHLFYQFNPASTHWGNVYWGHAISKDLLHWRHLPIVLFPQDALKGRLDRKGGAYSGSAEVTQEGIRLYFTRHYSPLEKGITTKEAQFTCLLPDGVHAENEECIIDEFPHTSKDYDFRDPKIEWIDNERCLLIAGTQDKRCCIFRYSKENEEWRYAGLLYSERLPIRSFECPTLVMGDNGDAALLCSLQAERDAWGRMRKSVAYCGRLRNGLLLPDKQQNYDFGTECYAVQTFRCDNRTLGFGWILSAYGEYLEDSGVCNGCMSIPREFTLRNGRVYTQPAREMKSLFGNEDCLIPAEYIEKPVPDRCYHLQVEWTQPGDFSIEFVRCGNKRVSLLCQDGITHIQFGKEGAEEFVRLFEKTGNIYHLEAFIDHTCIEVFINNGAYTATKTYFYKPDGMLRCSFSRDSLPNKIIMHSIESVWL